MGAGTATGGSSDVAIDATGPDIFLGRSVTAIAPSSTTPSSPNSLLHASNPPTSSTGILFNIFRNSFSYIARKRANNGELAGPNDSDEPSHIVTKSNFSRLVNSAHSWREPTCRESSIVVPVTLRKWFAVSKYAFAKYGSHTCPSEALMARYTKLHQP
jgi:hypothetical protein